MRSAAAIFLCSLLPCFSAIKHWEFNGSLLPSGGGSNLVAGAALPATAPDVSFTDATINGGTAQVAAFTRGTFFRLTHQLPPNGGGSWLNDYTLIMDVMFPDRPTGWAALFQTSPANANDGDWFINPSQGLGISGIYGGLVEDGVWHRLALVVSASEGTLTSYINGTQVQQIPSITLDGRWSLDSSALLFADENQENAAGFVNSVQIRDVALLSSHIAALGGPTPGGIPVVNFTNPPAFPFGLELQTNGGFESMLSQWQTILGQPRVLGATDGKGSPHSGLRFFHGGSGGNAIVSQEIDLIAVGFTVTQLDSGVSLDAEAWLRNWYAAGVFDDQVYCRVAFLDASRNELSSVRCIVAADNLWLWRPLTAFLPAGTRFLRVEIIGNHRRDLDNDSMADDIRVRLRQGAPVTPHITKLPMLQDIRPEAMTLIWETDANLAPHAVDWGVSNVTENALTRIESLEIDATHFVQRATITGLQRATRYVYRVRSGDAVTPVYSFRTAPERETPFAVAWWGDNHHGTNILRTHVANLLAHGPDFIAVAGDMVNNGNVMFEWHDYWFKPLEHLNCAQTIPVIFARGNHDGEHALAYAYSALPNNEAWFAFDYGNTRFIFLDSEVTTADSPQQLAWLKQELARPEARRAMFRVVCFHRPPWVNLWNGGGYTGEFFVRNDWVPLFETNNVDIVISGHAHNYNRGASNGVTYVISGGGGGVLDVERVANWPLFTVEYSRYHFDLMEVDNDVLTWQTYDNNNQLIDQFTLRSKNPSLFWNLGTPAGNTAPLFIYGRSGTSYILERSSDLIQWTALATNVISPFGRATNQVDLSSPQHFFRARTLR
jgi:3',5'-cyclic AMP phosphodiesterase CpdA